MANLPGHGLNKNDNDKPKKWIKLRITKEPIKTYEEIKGDLSDGTICRCSCQSVRLIRRTIWLKRNHKKASLELTKLHVDRPQSLWKNVLWTDETEVEQFAKAHQVNGYRKKK